MAAERKTLTQLSVPICLETLFYMLSGMVDTLMLSSVSDQAVGAVGTANTYIGMFIIMFSVISTGMMAVMTQNIGAGKPGVAYQARQLGLTFNITLGLITNCYSEEMEVIKKSVLYDFFDSVCMSCEMGIKKPDVEIFKKSMRDLMVEANECLYIGDGGTFELETAQTLGMYPLQATWYLKDGVNQPTKRKKDFLQAESPLEVMKEIDKHKE